MKAEAPQHATNLDNLKYLRKIVSAEYDWNSEDAVKIVDLMIEEEQKPRFGEWSIDDIWMALEDHEYLDGDTMTEEEALEAFDIATNRADFSIGFGWDNIYMAIDEVVARRED